MNGLAVLWVCAALVTGAAAQTARVGQAAPDFDAPAADGGTVHLRDFEGRIVVLEWTSADCPFVTKHYASKSMQSLQKRATAGGVVWLSVVVSAPGGDAPVTRDAASALTASRKGAPTRVLLDPDGALGRLYGVTTTPQAYVVGGDGTLRYAGAIDTIASADASDIPRADNYVEAALAALAEGGTPVVTRTKPYGCPAPPSR